MTEDDQLPFDGPSDDGRRQGRLEATKTLDRAEVEPIASDRATGSTARASEGLVAEQRDEPPITRVQKVVQESTTLEHQPAAAEPSVPEQTQESGATRAGVHAETLYFLTNRMNLNGVLSSRIVGPRESFEKYYTDLLEQTPGWVPLLRSSPTSEQLEAVTSERGSGTPVIIEFLLELAGRPESDESVVFVPAVAFSSAVAIHFPSERDLREHRARGYRNVHAHDELLRVTPELFRSQAADPYAATLPKSTPVVDWRRIDRIRGAVNAAFRSASSGEQLAIVAALVGAPRLPAAVTVPWWLAWSEIDDHAAPVAALEPDGAAMPDHLGFRAAYEVLGEWDAAKAWSPNAILDAVGTRVREADLNQDAADAIVPNFDRVRAILNVEVEFEPFRPSTRALVSAKALLLVLLRQELDQLLAWSEEETGADDATRVVAAVLAGRLRGLSRESTELRSLELDDLTAAWAVRVASGGSAVLGKARFIANSRGTSLKIDDREVATQTALLPDLVTKYRKTADAKKETTRINVSRAMGWPVTYRLNVPPGAATSEDAGMLTIITPGEVKLTVSVDEEEFLLRLNSTSGGARQRAHAAFQVRKR